MLVYHSELTICALTAFEFRDSWKRLLHADNECFQFIIPVKPDLRSPAVAGQVYLDTILVLRLVQLCTSCHDCRQAPQKPVFQTLRRGDANIWNDTSRVVGEVVGIEYALRNLMHEAMVEHHRRGHRVIVYSYVESF